MRPPEPNPLKTRADLQAAFLSFEKPLLEKWKDDSVGPDIGAYRARYTWRVTQLEIVARYLWGLVPFTAGGGVSQGWPHVLDAINHGTDPQHPDYWQPAKDTDQRSVEMASLGAALRLVPEKIWQPLSGDQKDRFAAWLSSMLDKKLVSNNWQFFRLMVTLGLRHIDRAPKDVDAIEQAAIDIIEPLYLGDGWYGDGSPNQCDYYIAMAFHFYSLMMARLATAGPVVKRIEAWKKRATEFQKSFAYWFAADGSALAFGRSLTYRFAQSAYWGGCGLAELPGFSPGQCKGLLLRNIRSWWQQPILTADGILSLGYRYPNLNMLEPYNAIGSPYWAFKSLAALQLPENDPFWTSAEEPLPAMPPRSVQKHSRFIVDRDADNGHVTAVSAGQWYPWQLRHRDAKYAKFAYSTFFGPCVGPNHEWLCGNGVDNTLSIVASDTEPMDGLMWQNHGLSTGHVVEADHVRSDWASAPGVVVRTWIVPAGAWHVRVHRVTTDRTIQVAEGGFVCPDPTIVSQADHSLCIRGTDDGVSGIIDLTSNRTASLNDVEPNSSLYYSAVRGPILVGRFTAGSYWLATAVLGAAPGSKASWDRPPVVKLGENAVTVIVDGNAVSVDLSIDPKEPQTK